MKSITYLIALLPLTRAQFSNLQLGLPPSLRIASMTHSGNGCEDQSSSPFELNEQNQLDIRTFLSMTARKGTGIATSEATKECDIHVKLRYNKGEQFAVYSERVFAPISLKKGMEAVQDTSLAYGSFSGLQTSAGIQHFTRRWPKAQNDIKNDFDPRITQDLVQDLTDTSSIPWSSCNGEEYLDVKLKTELIGSAGNTGTYYAQEVSLGVEETIFTMMWRKCATKAQPKPAPPPPATPTFESAGVGFGQGQINPSSGAINADPQGPPPPPLGWSSGVTEMASATPKPSSGRGSDETIENGLLTWPTRRSRKPTNPTET